MKAVVLFQVVTLLKNQVRVQDPPRTETLISQLPESVTLYHLNMAVSCRNFSPGLKFVFLIFPPQHLMTHGNELEAHMLSH